MGSSWDDNLTEIIGIWMLPEILTHNLKIVFVGTSIPGTSNELGFYYLHKSNKFWSLLEYAHITPSPIISPSNRDALMAAYQDDVLSDEYKRQFFKKKEAELLRHRIGLTDLNRRVVVGNDDDPLAEPTKDDVEKFINNMEKYNPQIIGFVTSEKIFKKCFKPLYSELTEGKGKQKFKIGSSEVWYLGSTSGRVKNTDALEQVFEDLANSLNLL